MTPRVLLFFLSLLLAWMPAACAANGGDGNRDRDVADEAQVAERWQQPPQSGTESRTYRTMFVVGVAHTEELRRVFEDEFVRQLEGEGVRGIPSHSVMPPPAEGQTATRDDVVRAVRSSDADGVVVTRLLKREQRHKATFSPQSYYAHYTDAARSHYAPPVIYRTEVVTMETRLFDAGSEQQVWAATTEAFDPRATRTEITRLVRAIVKDLKKGKLI